jgi:hypothetical protein
MQNPETGNATNAQSAELDWPMERVLRLALEIKYCRQEIEEAFRHIGAGQFCEPGDLAEARIGTLIDRVRECGLAMDRAMGGKGHWRSWIYDWTERLSHSRHSRLG